MVYEYGCSDGHEFEVIKSVKQIDDPEACPTCGKIGTRYISRTSFYGASDWDSAEYNPGLGCVVKNRKERDRIAKERGLIEIGNEDMSKTMARQERRLHEESEAAVAPALEAVEHGLKQEMGKI